ncbi:MAG: hypothetical protein M3Y08_01280 [Fibrobacterota bacterium]|nr:hypothetical protein [Fibrobacterota bacterium]
MLLADMSAMVNRALRFKLHPANIIVLLDAAQRYAFDYDAQQFLYWSATLTPRYNLTFQSTGYTSAIVGDIGKTVVSGAKTGTLVSYDNTTRIWVISTTDTWTDGAAVTITTGTGAGTLIASASQTGYLGPYTYPTTIPVRKLWGVTAETDVRIFGSDTTTQFPMNDFDFAPRTFDPKQLLKPGRKTDVDATFTFIDSPALPSAGAVYRWVYWRNPPTIADTTTAATLILPAAYHLNMVNVTIKLAQLSLNGEDVDPQVIRALYKPWWDTLANQYTPMGNKRNGTLNPGQSAGLII